MPQERKSNQGGRGQSPTNGGQGAGAQGLSERAEGVGEDLRRKAGDVTQAARERYDEARERVAHTYRRAEGRIARNPSTSVLIGFGLGVGAGLLLTALFAREDEPWYDRYVRERLRDVPDRLRAISVPEQVRDLPSRLRHLPEHLLDRIRS